LRESGIDPDALRRRFYEAARAIAAKEMTAGRPVPLSVEQAIEQMAPEDVMPSNTKAAEAKMARWIDSFSAPCSVPADLEAARAFRKRGDVAENEQAELDELERQLKDEIKKEHEGEA
jgi:hypothetical protein